MVALAETTTPARVSKVARREADKHLTEPLVTRHRAARELLRTGTGHPTAEHTPGGAEIEHVGLLATITPIVQVTILVTTLTNTADAPGSLDGAQPLDAETAKILAGAAATWQCLLTDPIRGTVVEVDTDAPTPHARHRLVGHPTRPGVLHWTSPLGAAYVDRPPPAGPRFVETRPDDPALPPPDLPC